MEMESKWINGSGIHLSEGDRAVLDRVFSPHLPNIDVDIRQDYELCKEELDEEPATACGDSGYGELVAGVKQLEMDAVDAAEKGDLVTAERLFTEIIGLAPERASSYNNRAQTRRLLDNVSGAESDLEKALQLSAEKGVVACQAFNQRALIRSLKGDENGSLEDLKRASHLGSEFAKRRLIALNPYAAMCNAMMTEMMTKIRRGETI